MSTLLFRDYSLRHTDLIDLTPEAPAEPPRPPTTATKEDVAEMVVARLREQLHLLYPLIEEEMASPTERGRTARVHPMTALRLCQALNEMAMDAIDQHADMVQAGQS